MYNLQLTFTVRTSTFSSSHCVELLIIAYSIFQMHEQMLVFLWFLFSKLACLHSMTSGMTPYPSEFPLGSIWPLRYNNWSGYGHLLQCCVVDIKKDLQFQQLIFLRQRPIPFTFDLQVPECDSTCVAWCPNCCHFAGGSVCNFQSTDWAALQVPVAVLSGM